LNFQEANNERIFNVIISWTYTEWGGAQIYFLSIIKNAPPNWKFTIVLPKDSKPDIIKFFEPYGVKFEFFDISYGLFEAKGIVGKLKRQWRRIYSEYAAYRKLSRMNLENSVLHIENAPWQSWILIYLLTQKTDVFVTMHNALPIDAANWRKKIWSARLNFLMKQKTFHFFAANENAIDSLKKYISSEFWDKLTLTRASINPREIEKVWQKDFDRNELLKKHDLPTDKFIVLCVGQFIDRKGRWIFLETAREIAEINKDILFVWLMPQFPGETDRRKANELQLNESFRMILSETVGKKREDVLQFFRIADVFTLPSLWEGLPIAILEAMALGIPTISTDLNAIPEAVKHNETGLLVKIGDSKSLSEAVLKMYQDKNLREQLGKNGRRFVLENFDEQFWARIALENYEKCLTK
jgi:glycosyltransferase involved in cell wall biosynthesis